MVGVLDSRYRRPCGIGDMDERPHAATVADQRKLDRALLTNGVHINRCVDIHDPASVENEFQLFVRHFEDVSAV